MRSIRHDCRGWRPGFVADKAAALIKSLPKAQRRNFVPAPDFARAFVEAVKPGADTLSRCPGALPAQARGRGGGRQRIRRKHAGAAPAREPAPARMPARTARPQRAGRIARPRRVAPTLRRGAAGAFAEQAAAGLENAATRFPTRRFRCRCRVPAACPHIRRCTTTARRCRCACMPNATPRSANTPRRAPAAGDGAGRQAQAGAQAVAGVAEDRPAVRRDRVGRAARAAARRGLREGDRLRADLVDGAFAVAGRRGLEEIRDVEAFAARREAIAKQLFGEAMERLRQAEAILAVVAEARAKLESPLMGGPAATSTTCAGNSPR